MRHARRQQLARYAAQAKRAERGRLRAILNGLLAFSFAGLLGYGGYQGIVHPETPLPPQWNPIEPLQISHPVTPLSGWKLNRAAADAASCLAALAGQATIEVLEPRNDSDQCFIADRVNVDTVGHAQVASLETRCAIALRMAMWEEHSLQPAAERIFGTSVTRIDHIGSYNCRQLRTVQGPSERMSTHATADAVDITGFTFADGRQLRLLEDWDSAGANAEFLRAARDGACDWFELTLSPDFNALHADHFHLQSRGWGGCR
ncbi:extensin-like domain-containing protein [Loktanella sp. Alg231-35]|uniref:extensin-like domain-containing protein n=1 Tax=Loktanella sp. Alg231-35 TaxID=1922220 RepID=UPI000D5530FC|nr:extensin family protein [Loktanella sp. Alg231-35]